MKKFAKGFTLVELMIVVAIIGILSAVAIPNFMKFQAKSRQSEVKVNLKGLYTAWTSRFAEKQRYFPDGQTSDFKVEKGNIYAYALPNNTSIDADMTEQPACSTGKTEAKQSEAGAAEPFFVAGACGNVDTDAFIDAWGINSNNCLANGPIDETTTGSACTDVQDEEAGNDVVHDE